MEPFVLFVPFVVVIQATINQFATPIRDLPINHADRSHLRSESSQSTDQSANSHSFVSMAECQAHQSRHVGSDSGNDCGNPVATINVDVSKDAIGGSASNTLLPGILCSRRPFGGEQWIVERRIRISNTNQFARIQRIANPLIKRSRIVNRAGEAETQMSM